MGKMKFVVVILQKIRGKPVVTATTMKGEDELEAAKLLIDCAENVVCIHIELETGKYMESRVLYKGARILMVDELGTYKNERVRVSAA